MGIIILFLGKLFFNSCLHGFQQLNCYNHVFKLFASTWNGPKFVANWKIKFKYLKIGEKFLQIFGFVFMHPNIDVVNIPI